MSLNETENTRRKKLWEEGLTDTKIANVCEVSRAAIHDWRKKNGLKSNSKGKGNQLDNEETKVRTEMVKAGYTDAEIASFVGISRQSMTFWRHNHGLYKDRTLNDRYNDLGRDEVHLLHYLQNKYPGAHETHLVSLTKFAKPRANVTPTVKQRDSVRKIKVPGFKTIYYFDDGEYSCAEEAMKLFIELNPHIPENMGKIRTHLSKDLYEIFKQMTPKRFRRPSK